MPLSKIPANGISSIANTAISGNVVASQITSIANTQITGLLTPSQLANTFVEAATATSFTGKQTFSGTTSVLSSKFVNALETTTVNTSTWNSTANTINYDITTQSILYYTSNCANNFTVNLSIKNYIFKILFINTFIVQFILQIYIFTVKIINKKLIHHL